MSNGFYPLKETLKRVGFEKIGNLYNDNKNVTISFDSTNKTFTKNGYNFLATDQIYSNFGTIYASENLLEALLNKELSYKHFQLTVSNTNYSPGSWTTHFPGLVAHAGGTYRGVSHNTFYTNSLEALQQNYSLGHRVFEFDFFLTSDNQLAVVHDWDQFGYMNGQALSAEEWKKFSTFGSPITESRFTTMLIGDLLDQMMINKDLFLVTDTKTTSVSEEMALQFRIIYKEAQKRDPELINRIIPQIYSEEMYDAVKAIYDFPSIIYTLYATQPAPEDVLSFIKPRPDIHVVTAPASSFLYTTPDFIQELHEMDRKLYVHTIHTYDELTKYAGTGIDGFYTGLLLPEDFERYMSLNNR